jgi:polar amino acid transport system substrate-binding protein
MLSRTLTAALSAAALALSVAGCAKDDTSTTTGSGVKLVKSGTLTICTHLPYAPFEFTQDGQVVGFDIDVLKIAADDEGLKTAVVDTPWDTIVSGEALNTGKCDVAAGAMTIKPEREKVMDFTDPYFEATQALLTKKGSGITSLDQLAGKTIAVQEGTTGEDYVKEHTPKGAKVVSFEDSVLTMQAVKTGKAVAGVNDNGLLYNFVKQNPDTEVTTEFKTGEEYGFSVKKDGNDALLDVINSSIADKDAYEKAFSTWFGETAPQ